MRINPEVLVPTPFHGDHKISPWIDEQIWGHRIWDSQSPWLIYLEFLTVAEACYREGRLFDEKGVYYPMPFKPSKRMYLRNILFNNEELVSFDERNPDSKTAWSKWLKWMSEKAQGVPSRDFSYLRERFHTFHDFAALVNMLRTSSVESDSNKRWTSRFVFPFGANAYYEDLDIVNGNLNRQYINFGRTGELLYLMLARSSSGSKLMPHVAHLIDNNNRWNSLLGLFQPGQEDDQSRRGNSYLPYRQHSSFDRLGKDWLSIFDLGLPGFDAILHLVLLGALHILLYQLEVAAEWTITQKRPHIICEVVAPKKTLVRELSFANYMANNALPSQAIDARLDDIRNSDKWQAASVGYGAFTQCKQILEESVRWPNDADDYPGPSDPENLFNELRTTALRGHRQHVANVHRRYGRDIGLVSRRGTNKLRYAPNDTLLKTLLFANVETRMEFNEFLEVLYARYGFVFGDREAERALSKDDLDKKSFQANARRLEERLSSLGMLRRLSDACAYVENPYTRR